MSFTDILALPEVYQTQAQWDQAVNTAHGGIECATNDIEVLDMGTGNIALTYTQQVRAFLFHCKNLPAARELTLNSEVVFLTEARRFIAVRNDGPYDLTVKLSGNPGWSDTLVNQAAKLYYISGPTIFVLGSYGGAGAGAEGYDVSIFLSGQPPVTDEIYRQPMTRDVRFEGDFAGSRASARVDATANTVFTIWKNSTQVGSLTMTSSGSHTFVSNSGSPVLYAPGNNLIVKPPASQDASLADVGITLKGVLI